MMLKLFEHVAVIIRIDRNERFQTVFASCTARAQQHVMLQAASSAHFSASSDVRASLRSELMMRCDILSLRATPSRGAVTPDRITRTC